MVLWGKHQVLSVPLFVSATAGLQTLRGEEERRDVRLPSGMPVCLQTCDRISRRTDASRLARCGRRTTSGRRTTCHIDHSRLAAYLAPSANDKIVWGERERVGGGWGERGCEVRGVSRGLSPIYTRTINAKHPTLQIYYSAKLTHTLPHRMGEKNLP